MLPIKNYFKEFLDLEEKKITLKFGKEKNKTNLIELFYCGKLILLKRKFHKIKNSSKNFELKKKNEN